MLFLRLRVLLRGLAIGRDEAGSFGRLDHGLPVECQRRLIATTVLVVVECRLRALAAACVAGQV